MKLPQAAIVLLLGCLLLIAVPQPAAALKLFGWNMNMFASSAQAAEPSALKPAAATAVAAVKPAAAAAVAVAKPAAAAAVTAAAAAAAQPAAVQATPAQYAVPQSSLVMSAMVVKPAELDVVETQQPAQLSIMKANHNALSRPDALKAPQKAVQSAAEEKKAATENLKAQLESVEVGGGGGVP